jgi:tetratricopeptide (TPR) repeat protein
MKKGSLLAGLALLSVASLAQISILPDSVVQMIERQPKDSSLVKELNNIAFGYLQSNPILGRELAETSITIARDINFTRGYARAVNVKGSSYWVVGDYEAALEQYHKSAKAASAIDDQRGLSEAYHNIGEVHKKLGDYRKAIRFLETSLEWDRKNGDNYAITLYNIGEAYFERDEYPEASSYFDAALKQAVIEKDQGATAYAYNGMGKLFAQEGKYEEALVYFRKAESIWSTTGDLRSMIRTYQDYSEAYVALHDLNAALASLTLATSVAEDIQAYDLQASNYDRISQLYYRKGEFKKSADFLRMRKELRDSIYDLTRSQQIAQLQVAFEKDARLIENQQLKATRALQEAKIRTQGFMIVAISIGLMVAGLSAYVFFRQRKKIQLSNGLLHEKSVEINRQKEEIECQAQKMSSLNQQLQDLNKSLEYRIEERTHELWWKNQKLADYAHTNSHKLRAPVASILGLIQLINRVPIAESDKILIEKLQVCAGELDKVTRDINQRLEDDPELNGTSKHVLFDENQGNGADANRAAEKADAWRDGPVH